MYKSLIPNFLFYPNIDKLEIIKNIFYLFKEEFKIILIKKKVNIFFSLYNFTLIYFYIGNFFIKNKLKKTLKNLLHIENNFYILSNENLNFRDNLKFFLRQIKEYKKYNINKVILKLENQYYLPLNIIGLFYNYYLFFSIFLMNLKLSLALFNLKILNSLKLFNKFI